MSNTLKVSRVVSMYRRVVLAEVMSWNSWSYPYRKLTYPTGSLTTLTGSLIVNGVEFDSTRVDTTRSFKKSTRQIIPRERMGGGVWNVVESWRLDTSRHDSFFQEVDSTNDTTWQNRGEGSEMSSSRHDSTRVDTTRSFKKSTPLVIRFSETRVQTKENYACKQN